MYDTTLFTVCSIPYGPRGGHFENNSAGYQYLGGIGLTHCTTGHRGQLNTHYHQTNYPSSPQLTYDMTTDYNKTDGLSPTTRKLTGHNLPKTQSPAFAQTTIPTNIHTVNIMFTHIILIADKHNIPKGMMHINCSLLPDHIVYKITQRNNIRTDTNKTYGRNTYMHTGIRGTTHTLFGRPYTVYAAEHPHPH